MQTAKLFKNGRSQAVRLPKEFRFEGDEVYVKRVAGGVVLLSKDDPWASIAEAYALADPKHPDPPPQGLRRRSGPSSGPDAIALDTDICIEALRRRSEPLLRRLRRACARARSPFRR